MLFRIIYAAKANGSHHKLALDALTRLDDTDGNAWQRLFLKYVDVYLEGSKAPDKEFKDFKNHVLHVGDDFWGGAPEKAAIWYDKLVRSLQQQQFEEAVYCAGVLSHYYTDPIQPFHTAQSEAENNMHRAVEWSISKSYDALRKRGEKQYAGLLVEPGDGPDWVQDMVRRGAMRSHRYYQPLISNYNLAAGVVDPEQGLNEYCRGFLSELIIYASTGFARILDRSFKQAAVTPPEVDLSMDTFLAALNTPIYWVLRKLEDADDRRIVQAAYDELQATGSVERNLSEDDRAVREMHRREVVFNQTINWQENLLEKRKAERLEMQQRNQRTRRQSRASQPIVINLPQETEEAPQPAAARENAAPETVAAIDKTETASAPVANKARLAPVVNRFEDRIKPAAMSAKATEPADQAAEETVAETEAAISDIKTDDRSDQADRLSLTARVQAIKERAAEKPTTSSTYAPRYFLSPADDIEAAPSIGPKTAKRLQAVGIETVDEFMNADTEKLAGKLNVRWIGAKTLRDWKDQARLCMDVAEMRGGNAQVLVAAGVRTRQALRDMSAGEVQALLNLFCQTKEGKNLRACESLPSLARIELWLKSLSEDKASNAA